MFSWVINNRIAFDLDEVLANTFEEVLGLHKKKWYLNHLQFEDLIDHEWRKLNNAWIDKQTRYKIWHEFMASNLMENIPPAKWSLEVINALSKKWFELHIITARPNHVKKNTNTWIKRNFQNQFEELHFATTPDNIHTPKFEICKKLWINLIIEDNMDYAVELADNNIKVIILEKPWNKHRTEKHKNIIRVKNWHEIIKNI